ncbi:phosphotransferase-like protein [Ramlibacter sp. PS4R-6]|uniref:phosphotransferase-like protein n=1 Tax=Ramlibacter sp. PS4R-6 TaxID=3133438 RepID=UPI0030B1FC23
METDTDAPQLVVISGGSSSGKTTLARALQEELMPRPWLHFSIDAVLECLPKSVLDRANRYNDWSLIDSRAVTAAAFQCVRVLLERGHSVVFECVVASERAAGNLLRALGEFQPVMVGLRCSWEETERRTLSRGDRTLEEAEHGYWHASDALVLDYEIDTSLRTPRDIARQLAGSLRSGGHLAWRANVSRY